MEQITIQETREHRFYGLPPHGYATWREFGEAIPRFDVVSEALYEGDDDPFHIVLDVLYREVVSENGLIYDHPLINAIKEQLPGSGGILGHLPPGENEYAFPIEDVDWVGLKEVGNVVYAKAYVPPGEVRNFFKRIVNRGGVLKTSIDGQGVREMVDLATGTWRAKNFTLNRLDLAPASKAALKKYLSGNVVITREMTEREETPMTKELDNKDTTKITLNDIPDDIREQIIRDAKVKADAGRVSELEQQMSQLETQVSEMRQFASLVTEIRSYLGEDTDILKAVQEMHTQIHAIKSLLGEDVNISIKIEEMHTHLQEMQTTQRQRQIQDGIAELTDWSVTEDKHIAKRDNFRQQFQQMVLVKLSDNATPQEISETIQKVYADGFQQMAESLVAELGGPSALVAGKDNKQFANWKERWASKQGRDTVRETWGV